jgi:hypothetical protein
MNNYFGDKGRSSLSRKSFDVKDSISKVNEELSAREGELSCQRGVLIPIRSLPQCSLRTEVETALYIKRRGSVARKVYFEAMEQF